MARILSLLLFAALCVLSIRSYWVNDRLSWTVHDPGGHWVTDHVNWLGKAPPVYVAIEKFTLTFGEGRVRLAHVGWNCYDTWSKNPGLSSPPLEPRDELHPPEVSRQPGLSLDHPPQLTSTFMRGREGERFGFFNESAQSTIWYSGWRSADWTLYVHEWGVPILLPLALSAVLPALWARRLWLDRFRRRAGACANCGYDLRATPQRCPECGTTTAGV